VNPIERIEQSGLPLREERCAAVKIRVPQWKLPIPDLLDSQFPNGEKPEDDVCITQCEPTDSLPPKKDRGQQEEKNEAEKVGSFYAKTISEFNALSHIISSPTQTYKGELLFTNTPDGSRGMVKFQATMY
jgi:hypothetical protein